MSRLSFIIIITVLFHGCISQPRVILQQDLRMTIDSIILVNYDTIRDKARGQINIVDSIPTMIIYSTITNTGPDSIQFLRRGDDRHFLIQYDYHDTQYSQAVRWLDLRANVHHGFYIGAPSEEDRLLLLPPEASVQFIVWAPSPEKNNRTDPRWIHKISDYSEWMNEILPNLRVVIPNSWTQALLLSDSIDLKSVIIHQYVCSPNR